MKSRVTKQLEKTGLRFFSRYPGLYVSGIALAATIHGTYNFTHEKNKNTERYNRVMQQADINIKESEAALERSAKTLETCETILRHPTK